MPDYQYPVFEGGQTLTAADLNVLRTFGHDRDRLLGRLTGFGVNCGLDGTVSGTTLTIAPGLAVDQAGEPLVLPTARTITLPPAVSPGTFGFVSASPGGHSVVLEATDTAEPAPECGDEDCERHAELHTRGVALRVVPGRISGPRFDFASEPLLGVEPMRLSLTSSPQGSYTTLRNAIVTRLTNAPGSPLISSALITALQGTSIATSDLPGVRGYKAGFLNQVLFAALDLLRCQALMATSCDRSTPRPGVVLGWVRLVGGTWTWDCGYRHAWEPPRGLSQSLVGGGCASPCGMYVDALEALIAGYAPPDPPPPDDDDDGPIIVFPWCPQGMHLVGGRCVNIYFPPERIPPHWVDIFEIDPRDPIWNPPYLDRIDSIVETVYDHHRWEYLGVGTITVLPGLGHRATTVLDQLSDQIRDHAATPNVTIVTAAEAAATPGYEPGGTANLADAILLTADAQGRVIATGRVPAAYTARQVGVELPAASHAATMALKVAEAQQAGVAAVTRDVGVVTEQIGGLAQEVAGLAQFSQQTGQWRGQVDSALAGMPEVITSTVDKAMGAGLQDIQVRLATAEGAIGVLTSTRSGGTGGAVAGGVGQRLDQDFAHGMTEFAETVIAGLSGLVHEENQKTLGRYVGEMTRASAKLEVVAAGGDPIDIGDAAVALLGTMRTAVKAAGVDDSIRKQLDVQFNAVKGMLG